MGRRPKFSKEIKIKACKDYDKSNGSFVFYCSAYYDIINTINETKTFIFVLMYLLNHCDASRFLACFMI